MIQRAAHALAGLLSALAVVISPVLPVLGFAIFLVYELDEGWHLNDPAFEELREFGCGFFAGVVVLLITSGL